MLYAGIHERQIVEGTASRLPGYLDLLSVDIHGSSCLDVGSGSTARDAIRMFEAGAAFVTLVDVGDAWMAPAREQLAARGIARERYRMMEESGWVADGLPAQVDFAACNGVLHHVEDADRTLRAIARDIRPGGHFYAMVMGRGGIVRDFVMHFLRDRYREDDGFRTFIDLPPDEMVQGIATLTSALATERDRPLPREYAQLLEALIQGCDVDLMLTLKDRIISPLYREYSPEEFEDLLQRNGLQWVERVYPAPEFSNIRAILEPAYAHPDRGLATVLMGSGNLHVLSRRPVAA